VKFVLRVDDWGWASAGVPDAGLALARKFMLAMTGWPMLAAIIPACLDDEGRRWLKSRPPGVTVAMHGYQHERAREGCDCEFEGMSPRRCRRMVHTAKNALQIGTRHFVAPWNQYTPQLTEALLAEGMDIHWHGIDDKNLAPAGSGPLVVPCWRPLYGAALWEMSAEDRPLKDVLPQLLDAPGSAVICLHITWEATRGEHFPGVRWLVDLLGDRLVSTDEYLA